MNPIVVDVVKLVGCLRELLVGGFAAVVEDIDDDGGTDKGGDAVNGHGTLEAWSASNQITNKRQQRTTQGGGGHQLPVVARAEYTPCQMGHCHTDEHDGTAIGGDNSNQGARADDNPCAGTLDINA